MRRAWVVVLASCGFQGPIAKDLDPDADPPLPDAPPGSTCWTHPAIKDLSACAIDFADQLDINSATFDTTPDATTPPGLRCAEITNTAVCALVANSILLRSDKTLQVLGSRPLALLANRIQIDGKLDAASHVGGKNGPGVVDSTCNSGNANATGVGGGAGGTLDGNGGNGGRQGGGEDDTAGHHGDSTSTERLRAGCSGGHGSHTVTVIAPSPPGGAGGGALWIAATEMLALGSDAVINASGASGRGGRDMYAEGGGGGGSGGFIVLQAPAIVLTATSQIFANGGAGGGGSRGNGPGADGADPTGATSGGLGGLGGSPFAATPFRSHRGKGLASPAMFPGGGGPGFPEDSRDGADGDDQIVLGGGGGGGGGGDGIIIVPSSSRLDGPNVSPPPRTQ